MAAEKSPDVYTSAAQVRHYSERIELQETEQTLLDSIFPPPGAFVLDLGCGAGRTTLHLKERGYRIVAVDIAPAMVEQARQNIPGVDFRVMDAAHLEFPDDTFDVVWFSFNGIDHVAPVANRIAALKQIYRVLKPGGLFVYSSKNAIEMIFEFRRGFWFWRHMVPYVLRHLVKSGLSPYWEDGEFEVYCAPPFIQKSALRRAGFEDVQLHSSFSRKEWVVTFFDRYPHYAARKPPARTK